MYKDSAERSEELLEEAAGLLGMIAEVRAKSVLLRNKNKRKWDNAIAGCPEEPEEEWCEEVGIAVAQMQDDLAKYRHRIQEIYEELAGYGIVVPEVS